jgi:hypothetical protein
MMRTLFESNAWVGKREFSMTGYCCLRCLLLLAA